MIRPKEVKGKAEKRKTVPDQEPLVARSTLIRRLGNCLTAHHLLSNQGHMGATSKHVIVLDEVGGRASLEGHLACLGNHRLDDEPRSNAARFF